MATDQAGSRIPVALVLGSGGARGLAQIGVIRDQACADEAW